jgi:hypothetical protein
MKRWFSLDTQFSIFLLSTQIKKKYKKQKEIKLNFRLPQNAKYFFVSRTFGNLIFFIQKKKSFCYFLYFFSSICRKRFRVNSEDDVNLVHREHPIGKQTKSVQVHFFTYQFKLKLIS